jgi:4-diphosphocytidyl-2C-methyl-D-erythritol kinase
MALQFIKKIFRKGHKYVMAPQTHVVKDNAESVVMSMPQVVEKMTVAEEPQVQEKTKKRNNKKKSKEEMIDINKINDIEAVVEKLQPEVKVVKADRGLIERTESSKIIITEDNRQVLND